MAYKPKQTADVTEHDAHKLLSYWGKGIPLSEDQKAYLTANSYGFKDILTPEKLVETYWEQFVGSSALWCSAVLGGWAGDLENYVKTVAKVQAGMILKNQNVGWTWVVFGIDAAVTHDMVVDFLREQRRQAGTGNIDVGIPTGRVDAWKETAEFRKRKPPEKESVKQAHQAPVEKSRLDEEIDRQLGNTP